MKRIAAALAVAVLVGIGAGWLHWACVRSMVRFEAGYAAAAGDAGAP